MSAMNCAQQVIPFRVFVALMLLDRSVENRARKELQNLTENAGYSFHGWVCVSSWLSSNSNFTEIRPLC